MSRRAEPKGAAARQRAYDAIPPDKHNGIALTHWHIQATHPHPPADGSTPADCFPTILSRDRVHRGACLGCVWEGPDRPTWTDGVHLDGEHQAVHDAHDHVYGLAWRDIPVVPAATMFEQENRVARANRAAMLLQVYGQTWADRRGPIRTRRHYGASRDVPPMPSRNPFGGYDLGHVDPDDNTPPQAG